MIIGTSTRLLGGSVRGAARPACAACETAAGALQAQQKRSAHKLVQVQLTADVPSLGPRGSVVITTPGRARNQLIPHGLALYVDRDGKAVSAARDMTAKATERMQALVMGASSSRVRRESERDRRAKAVLEGLEGAVAEDPLAPGRAADRALAHALASLPRSTLRFTRLTTSPTSHDLFGSVSVADVLTVLRDAGVSTTATGGGTGLSEQNAHFDDSQEGVVRGRIKQTGQFKFVVELKAIQEKKTVLVEVVREDAAKAAAAPETVA